MPDTSDDRHDTDDATDPTGRAADALREALDVAVGLGIMAVNRFQAVRREVTREPTGERPDSSAEDAGRADASEDRGSG